MPTILKWTETPAPDGLDGRDLAGILSNPASNKNRVLVAETWRFVANGEATHNMVTVFDGTYKLVCNLLDEALSARKQQGDKPLPYGEPKVERLQDALDQYLGAHGAAELRRLIGDVRTGMLSEHAREDMSWRTCPTARRSAAGAGLAAPPPAPGPSWSSLSSGSTS